MQDPRPSTLGQAHGVVSKLAERLLSRGQSVNPAASLDTSVTFFACSEVSELHAREHLSNLEENNSYEIDYIPQIPCRRGPQ